MKQLLFIGLILVLPCIKEGFAFETEWFNWNQNPMIKLASKHPEPLNEAPVPVTVITEDMIKNSGALTLKELLTLYVPGVTRIEDHNDINIAIRGLYSSAPQKFLILLNGHQLNSRVFHSTMIDYSIGLDKVKRIEVLRGAGSSLYGNTALAGVINIQLKKASDLKQSTLTMGIGSLGNRYISGLHGLSTTNNQTDILFWFQLYSANGEIRTISKEKDYINGNGGSIILDGFKDLPAYDIGINYRVKNNLSLLYNHRSTHYVPPFTDEGATGQIYDYDTHMKIFGKGAGLTYKTHHLDVHWKHTLSQKLNWEINTYFDNIEAEGNMVVTPSATRSFPAGGQEYTIGTLSQWTYTYSLNTNNTGTILIGTQADSMHTSGSDDPGNMNPYSTILLEKGHEEIYSSFINIKHRLYQNKIINMGLRYDYKNRYKGKDFQFISPRLSLIYLPTDYISIKATYSSSFADTPYFYRYNTFPQYKGDENLDPEQQHSFQFSPSIYIKKWGLNYTLTTFYNNIPKLLFRNNQSNNSLYQTESLKNWGIENELFIKKESYTTFLNFTYQKEINSPKEYGRNGYLFNVPSFVANLGISYHLHPNLDSFITAQYIGEQQSQIIKNRVVIDDNYIVNKTVLITIGIHIPQFFSKKFFFDARITNLLNQHHEQGGTTPFPYPQLGRHYFIKIGTRF
jgi:outer membrane receptor for ferrienterochelin and colicins